MTTRLGWRMVGEFLCMAWNDNGKHRRNWSPVTLDGIISRWVNNNTMLNAGQPSRLEVKIILPKAGNHPESTRELEEQGRDMITDRNNVQPRSW